VGDVRLVYGLGATKAGSGWLYRFLRAHPDCHLRALKELHFFDTQDFGLTRTRLQKLRMNFGRLQDRAAAGAEVDEELRDFAEWIPVAESGDRAAYLRFLCDGRDGRDLVADITPSYALVSVETLRKMADLLPDTRFVFLLRDPVARLWSHVRMLARRAMRAGADAGLAAAEALDRTLSGQDPAVVERSAYDAILTRLKSVVPKARLYVDFFEETVLTGATDRLCAFLGISPLPGGERRYHAGITLPLGQEQRRRMQAFLAPQYDFVRSEMGRLPAAWEASLAKD
jgi:Sulfotransferase family